MGITRRKFVAQMGAGAAIIGGVPTLPTLPILPTPPTVPILPIDRSPNGLIPPWQPCVRVVGVGGAGTLVLDRMARIGHAGIDLITVDTDAQSLRFRQAGAKLHIGEAVPRGLCGGGGRVEYGRGAAEESRERLHAVLDGADVVVVVAGMGGGTGTGAAPVVAEVARRLGALTLGVVSLPFEFEGRRRGRQAATGVRELADRLDTTVVVPSYALVPPADSDILFSQALERVDELMLQAAQSFTVPLVQPGLINVGVSDYRELFNQSGPALVATGVSDGEHRATGAAQVLLQHPVLDGVDLRRASAALVTIATAMGDDNLTICEIDEICTVLHESLGEATHVLTNVQDPTLGRGCRVTLTALGLDKVLGQDPELC